MDRWASCGKQQVSEKQISNLSPLESHEHAYFALLPDFEAPSIINRKIKKNLKKKEAWKCIITKGLQFVKYHKRFPVFFWACQNNSNCLGSPTLGWN